MTAVDAVRCDGHVELAVENMQYGVSGVFSKADVNKFDIFVTESS